MKNDIIDSHLVDLKLLLDAAKLNDPKEEILVRINYIIFRLEKSRRKSRSPTQPNTKRGEG